MRVDCMSAITEEKRETTRTIQDQGHQVLPTAGRSQLAEPCIRHVSLQICTFSNEGTDTQVLHLHLHLKTQTHSP